MPERYSAGSKAFPPNNTGYRKTTTSRKRMIYGAKRRRRFPDVSYLPPIPIPIRLTPAIMSIRPGMVATHLTGSLRIRKERTTTMI